MSPVLRRGPKDDVIELKPAVAFFSLCPSALANYKYAAGVNGDEWVETRKRHGRAGRLTIGYWTKGGW